MIPAARTDPWRCSGCGAVHELATRSLEVGLVRLAVRGEQNFRLGSADIESHVEPLLEPCGCGGRLTHEYSVPGTQYSPEVVLAAFDPAALVHRASGDLLGRVLARPDPAPERALRPQF